MSLIARWRLAHRPDEDCDFAAWSVAELNEAARRHREVVRSSYSSPLVAHVIRQSATYLAAIEGEIAQRI